MNRIIELNAREEIEEIVNKLEREMRKLKELYKKGALISEKAESCSQDLFRQYSRAKLRVISCLEKEEWTKYDKRILDSYEKLLGDINLP